MRFEVVTRASPDQVLLHLLHHSPMNRAIAGSWRSALDRFAESEAGADGPESAG